MKNHLDFYLQLLKSSSFSACFIFLSLATLVFLKDLMYFGKVINGLDLLNLRLNICFNNDSSWRSSNSSTRNILYSLTILIWVGIVTREAFYLTEMIWFYLYSSWTEFDDIKSRNQEKPVKLSSKFNSLLPHERSYLFQCSLYYFQASKLSLPAVFFLLFLKKSY